MLCYAYLDLSVRLSLHRASGAAGSKYTFRGVTCLSAKIRSVLSSAGQSTFSS